MHHLNKILITILGIITLNSCGREKKEAEKNIPVSIPQMSRKVALTKDQLLTSGIQTGKITFRVVSGVIKANGMLDVPPQNLVTVSAPLGGFVKYTDLLQGMKVKKGEIIATLEGPEFIQLQQDYLTSKSQLEYQRLEYERQVELSKENVNAVKTLQLSKANFLGIQAKVEGAAAMLRLIHIDPAALEKGSIQNSINLYSPINGFITQVNINIGMHVNPTDMMIRIIDTNDLHAEAQVFEKDISQLKIGQKVRVVLANDERERAAHVYLIGREITSERTIRVHCHFEKEDPTLIPGMYFSAEIETEDKSVTALPDNAIVIFEGKKYVFVENESLNFEMIEIKTGTSESGYTEVILPQEISAATAKIVTQGSYDLLSMLKNNEE